MEEKKPLMTFKNNVGNSFTITVEDPRYDLKEQDIIDFMNLVKDKNIFAPNGYDIADCVFAKIVESTTTEYDLI